MLDSYAFGGTALVLDPNPTSRSLLTAQLRDYGLTQIRQCSRVADARKLLENMSFDIVLCEMDFHDGNTSGSELLEDLRRENLLPLDTVFVMVTGEATYAKVAEAAESALDSYLLKPFTALRLFERLHQCKTRKNELRDIFVAVEEQRFEEAAAMCLKRFAAKSKYWLYAARIGAELLLRLERHEQAKTLLEAVTSTQALPWARLGIARAQLAANQLNPAKRTLESLLVAEPTYVDAYDVMGRVQVDQGEMTGALETFRKAAAITPGSITRQQKLGLMAFYMGDNAEATKALERATIMGMKSKAFDLQSVVLLGFLQFKAKNTKGVQRCLSDLRRALERAPKSARLRRFVDIVEVLDLMMAKQVGKVVASIRDLADERRALNFDVEAGSNFLSLASHLSAAEINLPSAEDWVKEIAQRFCTTKGVTELLAGAANAHAPYVEVIKNSAAEILTLLEKAMTHTVEGEPGKAVKMLLTQAEKTLNPRMLDTASGVLTRHGAKIPDAAQMRDLLQAMRDKIGVAVTSPPLGNTGKNPGGLSLRSDRIASADEVATEAAEEAESQES
jgi:CheY-like chemotaxis protein